MKLYPIILFVLAQALHCYSEMDVSATNAIMIVRFEDHTKKNNGTFLTEGEMRDFRSIFARVVTSKPVKIPANITSIRFPYEPYFFYVWFYDPQKNDMNKKGISFTETGKSMEYLIDDNTSSNVVRIVKSIKIRMVP